jgi:thiamine-monophosphate kinase
MFNPGDESVLLGPGDDAALVSVSEPRLVLTTDFRSDRNFLSAFEHKSYQHAGRLSVRQNASDVLASGAWPKWFLLSVMLPQDVTQDDIEALFHGVRDECAKLGVSVVGGDTKQGRSFQICGTMLGETSGQGWRITCAKPDMRLYVTGPVGGVTAALAALSDPALSMLHDEARATLADAEIPAKLMSRLIDARHEFAATDISDGLGFSIRHMANLTGLVPLVEAERVPRSSFVERVAQAMALPTTAFAFGFGGDFQFLLAAGENEAALLESVGAHRIGKLLDVDVAGAMPNRHQDGILVGDSIPDFGFLDFETISDIERFKAHAAKFTVR